MFWQTSITSTALPIISTSVLAFQYSSDSVSWTPLTTSNAVQNLASGVWWITHTAPAPGSYVFQVIMDLSTARKRADQLQRFSFRVTVLSRSPQSASSPITAGAIAGIVVAAVVSLSAVMVIVVILVHRRKRKQNVVEFEGISLDHVPISESTN